MRPCLLFTTLLGVALAAVTGCETPPAVGPGPGGATTGGPPEAADVLEADRAAIRALAGVFDVAYDARETVALQPGYHLGPGTRAEAREAVLLVEDTPARLTLEHLLLIGDPPAIAKHWRQTWTHEPASRLIYGGSDTWRREEFLKAVSGAWRVQVAEADERPSYEMVGRWTHGNDGVSTFAQGDPGARPVTARDGAGPDATRLIAVTRIEVAAGGWAWTTEGESHADEGPLARLLCVGSYRPPLVDATAALAGARSWWQRRGAFWMVLREAWHDHAAAPSYRVAPSVEGEPLWEAVFALEEAVRGEADPDPASLRPMIDELIGRYVTSP